MNVLILGGTYFAGRVFVMTARGNENLTLTLLNRGRYSFGDNGIKELKCDRHDRERIRQLLKDTSWDAVIDFCAYECGDIASVFDIPGFRTKHYLFLSSSSVCDVPGVLVKTEKSPVITGPDGTRDGIYAYKKACLEEELIRVCKEKSAAYTIFRPTFIYGPYNYAERESFFIQRIVQSEQVPFPVEATAHFQFVYVGDIAKALLLCLEKPAAKNRMFNLAGPEIMDYTLYFDLLEKVSGRKIRRRDVTAQEILQKRIPVPFPVFRDDLCDGSLITRELGFSYQSIEEGMRKTWNAFRKIYEPVS